MIEVKTTQSIIIIFVAQLVCNTITMFSIHTFLLFAATVLGDSHLYVWANKHLDLTCLAFITAFWSSCIELFLFRISPLSCISLPKSCKSHDSGVSICKQIRSHLPFMENNIKIKWCRSSMTSRIQTSYKHSQTLNHFGMIAVRRLYFRRKAFAKEHSL